MKREFFFITTRCSQWMVQTTWSLTFTLDAHSSCRSDFFLNIGFLVISEMERSVQWSIFFFIWGRSQRSRGQVNQKIDYFLYAGNKKAGITLGVKMFCTTRWLFEKKNHIVFFKRNKTYFILIRVSLCYLISDFLIEFTSLLTNQSLKPPDEWTGQLQKGSSMKLNINQVNDKFYVH